MDDFMNYMGFRNSILEEKIEECLKQVKAGSDIVNIDRGDLSDEEVVCLKEEVRRRARSGR